MASNQEYQIRTVEDFLKIPADRRKIAITEFIAWCAYQDEAQVACAHLHELGLNISLPTDVYIWVDDDLGEIRPTVTLIHKPSTPENNPDSTV